ncbi:MAG: ABC transporter permease [Chitinophagaceae bacterium]
MIRNYFTTAWRNILKNKGYSAINIIGLGTGMAVALLIGLWVNKEYSFDKYLPGYQDVYSVKLNITTGGEIRTIDGVSLPLEETLKKDIPEIKYVAESDWGNMHSLIVNDKKIAQYGIMAGPDYLKIFQYPLVQGNASTVLQDPYSIVLTQSVAKALFGNADPMNKTVRFDTRHDLKVTGIIKDVPTNSSIWFGYLVSFKYREIDELWVKQARTEWTNNSFLVYASLQPNADRAQLAGKIKDIVSKNNEEMRNSKTQVILHPMKDWRLYSDFENGKATGGYIDYVKMFSIIGMLVLLIACVNFMNLSTARSEKRAREVGVRKAIGSGRSQLIFQFIIESLLITFLGALLSIGILQLALPGFNTLTNSDIHIPWNSPFAWTIMAGFVIFTGLLAGSRPAFYLSSFRPAKVLKGAVKAGRSATLPRKVLVTLQFTCSVALIISTIIVYRQIQYTKSRPMGYNANRLLITEMSDDLNRNYGALKNELLQSGIVENMSGASCPINGIYAHTAIHEWPGKSAGEEKINAGAIGITDSYFNTVGMTLLSGRNFDNKWSVDSASVIINESAVNRMHLTEPLNQTINWNDHRNVKIIGVVKDAVMESPFMPVAPVVFTHGRDFNQLMYRLSANKDTHDALAKLTLVFNKYNPGYPYSYQFADNAYASKFNLEVLVGKLAGIFAVLAILISCLGLFGLAAYMAEQRKKEIGIRKVLGASVSRVWLLLSKEFLLLVVISCLIASPIALYFLNGWLLKYHYRITIGPGVFIAAGMMAIIITILTISFQAIKAAIANPVKSLRTE